MSTKSNWFALLGTVFMLFIFSGGQVVNAAGIISLTRSPDRSQYDVGEIVILDCEMDVDGTTRWFVENLTTGRSWYKNEHGSKVNQERLVLSELVDLGNGNQTIKATCEGRYGSGGWTGNNVTRRSMQFRVDSGTTSSPPTLTSGGMNFSGYCSHLGYSRAATGNNSNAFTWVCADGNLETGMDLAALCRWQYDGQLPHPGLDDPYNPNDWACYSRSHSVAQMPAPGNNNPPVNNSPVVVNPPVNNPPVDNTPEVNSPQGNNCPSFSAPVSVGDTGRITPGVANIIRSQAGTSHAAIDRIPAGATFAIIGGPECNDGYRWWRVLYDETTGWTADGSSGDLWIEEVVNNTPVVNQPQNSSNTCYAHVEPIYVGGRGRITPGVANRIRSGAGTNHSHIGDIPAGGEFDVLDGPICSNGYWWWRVNYNGTRGWTAEGTNTDDWIEGVGNSNSTSNETWCSASPSEVENFGWSRQGHFLPNPRLEIHFLPEVNLNDGDGSFIQPYFIYFMDEWVGENIVRADGWKGEPENVWSVGISTKWYVWSNIQTLGKTTILNRVNWRIDYLRPDGNCTLN